MPRTCRQCDCTDDRACVNDGVRCHWVEWDLCSACVTVRSVATHPGIDIDLSGPDLSLTLHGLLRLAEAYARVPQNDVLQLHILRLYMRIAERCLDVDDAYGWIIDDKVTTERTRLEAKCGKRLDAMLASRRKGKG